MESGIHQATIVEHTMAKASTGTQQLAVLFEVEGHGRITGYVFFTEAAMGMAEQQLRSMGWDPIERQWALKELNGTNMLVGQKVPIRVEPEEGRDGNMYYRVKFIGEGGGIAVKEPMGDAEVAAFGQQLRARMAAMKGGSTAARPAPKAEPELPAKDTLWEEGVVPPLDDDQPF